MIVLLVGLTAYLGGGARSDHQMHAAKVLSLCENGFTLQDPYSPLRVIESKFHINTLHALHAVGSHLTGQQPLEFWSRSAWFFRLLALGGIEYLALAVFGLPWVALTASLGGFWLFIATDGIALPQLIGAFVFFPVLMGQVLDFLTGRGNSTFIQTALSGLGLATLHVGYWVIVSACLAPTLLGWSLLRFMRNQTAMRGVLAVAALIPGTPFLLVTAWQPNHIVEQMGFIWLDELLTFYLQNDITFTILDPTLFLWMAPAVGFTILLIVTAKHIGDRVAILGTVFFTSMLYMFNPLFFGAMTKWVPYWIIRRSEYIGYVVSFVVIAGGLAWLSRKSVRTELARGVFAMAMLCAGLVIFSTWVKGMPRRTAENRKTLERARQLQAGVQDMWNERVLVAADEEVSLLLPAVHPSAVMSPALANANPADSGIRKRHADCLELLASNTPLERRREIAAEHDIDYVLLTGGKDRQEADFSLIGESVSESGWFRLFRLREASGKTAGQRVSQGATAGPAEAAAGANGLAN